MPASILKTSFFCEIDIGLQHRLHFDNAHIVCVLVAAGSDPVRIIEHAIVCAS